MDYHLRRLWLKGRASVLLSEVASSIPVSAYQSDIGQDTESHAQLLHAEGALICLWLFKDKKVIESGSVY